jgi:hypothetical protein
MSSSPVGQLQFERRTEPGDHHRAVDDHAQPYGELVKDGRDTRSGVGQRHIKVKPH